MGKLTGAEIVVRALEDEGIPFAFGIPGAQNLELYDVLGNSRKVRPILVTDEQCASFMADGAWRASGQLCCVNLVPGAGLTHALSGIAEAFMDGVPLLVLSSGVRSDIDKAFQLHDIDQLALARPVSKGQFHVSEGAQIYATLRSACHLARTPAFGPVIVEIPANLLVFRHKSAIATWRPPTLTPLRPSKEDLERVLSKISISRHPLLYLGVGCASAEADLVALAERLEAPVATTIQGKGVFPESHPLSLWCGFGPMAPPFVRSVTEDCDLTLAIGCRFAEVGTGSYGLHPPGALIHVDIDLSVFDRNYPAEVAVHAEARAFVSMLLERLPQRGVNNKVRSSIKQGHENIRREWSNAAHRDAVSPATLFSALQQTFGDRAVFVADSGNGLFEAMECLRLDHVRSFLGPVDFSCMGYAVPAAIGAAIAVPDRPVIAVEGDGALLMTGLELLTARHLEVAVVVVVLRDRRLAQIAQFQDTAYAHRTASEIADFDLGTLCRGMGIDHLMLARDVDVPAVLEKAKAIHHDKRPVVVESVMDDTHRTFFTRGVVRTNFGRLSWGDRFRFLTRAISRRLP